MGVGTIESVSIAEDTFGKLWGVTVNDYKYDSKAADFETLLINVSTTRAAAIEEEIAPISTIVRRRNEQLEELGEALSELTGLQQEFEKDGHEEDTLSVTAATAQLVNSLVTSGEKKTIFPGDTTEGYTGTKSEVAEAVELVKTRMDKLNNDSQSDMTRLQSLVDKRDESFKTASSLMSSVSDTRGNAIKSIG